MKEERFPHPGNPLHWLGDQLGQRELQRLRGECSSWLAAGRTEIDQQRQSWPPRCTHQLETCVCWYGRWRRLGAETQASQTDLGEEWDWLCGDSLKELERGLGHNWACARHGAQVCHRSPIVNAHVKGGVGPHPAALLSASSQWAWLHLYEFWEHASASGGPHVEEGLKSEPCPSGCATWADLCKLSICRTSKQITGAPVAVAGPVLAVVGFVGAWRWGWALG